MQIIANGRGEKDFAPDQIVANVTFSYRAGTYDEALRGGVEKVKNYIYSIAEATGFKPEDFKTRAYSVQEHFRMNMQKRASEGFFFSQFARLEFDYDKMRLANLLIASSRTPDAPMLRIDFTLKDPEAKKRELIAVAYEDAKKKAEVLATAVGRNLRDCVRVEVDPSLRGEIGGNMMGAVRGASADSYEQQLQNIDETFKPDDITLTKEITCVWETNN